MAALQAAMVRPGDELRVEADGAGRLVLTRTLDPLDEFAGMFTGVFPPSFLEDLRGEWER